MTQIPFKSGSRLLDSVAFLNDQHGLLLNGHITLNFAQLGMPDEPSAKAALTSMNVFLARKIDGAGRALGCEMEHFYVYAHESCTNHGWHVHELIAVHRGILGEIAGWLSQWVADRYDGLGASPDAVRFRPLGGKTEEMQIALQAKLVLYILKTMAPAITRDRHGQAANVLDLIGVTRRQHSSPLPIRRMTGASQNLCHLRQMKAGFRQPAHWEDLLSGALLSNRLARERSAELRDQLRDLDF
ncbi:hypothetical protein [Sphingomonas sp. CROZ-RG-20F-R02-07]|uniref:hypothetical protein n=1 Tax=Sphingomonas sp. CROZ-RG-20F-R02-07 TaxID=2914832 RepID=UPI001F5A8B63|nr:hypothetical protein [Sphingomonas sp. CROZ-RG-20F-R02-07]